LKSDEVNGKEASQWVFITSEHGALYEIFTTIVVHNLLQHGHEIHEKVGISLDLQFSNV